MEVRTLSTDEDHQVLDEYCSGYADSHGKWNTGFYCPTKSNQEAVYCCGTQTYKYCCTHQEKAFHNHQNPTRTQLDPRIILKIVGLTCVVSVLLTILTCYVCKRYWKRSDTQDNHVYRVPCTTSTSSHVYPLESLQPLHPSSFFKSPEHMTNNFCGDISVIPSHTPQYRLISSRPISSAAALYSYPHSSLSRAQRNHEPPPPYQLHIISGNSLPGTSHLNVASSQSACSNSRQNTRLKSIEATSSSTTTATLETPKTTNNTTANTIVKTLPHPNSPARDEQNSIPLRFIWRRLSQ